MTLVLVQAADRRPSWLILREWYTRLAIELDAIADAGGVRIGSDMYFLQDRKRGTKRAARQAERYRKAAELIDPDKNYDAFVGRSLT